ALRILTQGGPGNPGSDDPRRMSGLEAENTVLVALRAQRGAHEASVVRVERLVQERLHPEAALLFIGETLPALNALQASIQELGTQQRRNVERDGAEAIRGRVLYLGLALGAFTLFWSLGLLWRLRQGTQRGVRNITAHGPEQVQEDRRDLRPAAVPGVLSGPQAWRVVLCFR
ncbi:hypothetical protein P3G55_26650, partial [Leptospira sp. 96542]|nr:hypothetical protein [Leptospira sp. 96542]